MTVTVAAVVEGHGEVQAVPVLLRRVAGRVRAGTTVEVPPPIRIPKSKLIKAGELERAVDLAARKAGVSGGVLVLIDADDDCPAILGPELASRARAARSDLPVSVVLAKREYEAWFLAAATSLRGHRGLPRDLLAPADPEAIRGAKEWLGAKMPHGRRYAETLDQPALTDVFDFVEARSADSFDKCIREIESLLRTLLNAWA